PLPLAMVPGCPRLVAPDAGDEPRWPAPSARPRCVAWIGPWPPPAAGRPCPPRLLPAPLRPRTVGGEPGRPETRGRLPGWREDDAVVPPAAAAAPERVPGASWPRLSCVRPVPCLVNA